MRAYFRLQVEQFIRELIQNFMEKELVEEWITLIETSVEQSPVLRGMMFNEDTVPSTLLELIHVVNDAFEKFLLSKWTLKEENVLNDIEIFIRELGLDFNVVEVAGGSIKFTLDGYGAYTTVQLDTIRDSCSRIFTYHMFAKWRFEWRCKIHSKPIAVTEILDQIDGCSSANIFSRPYYKEQSGYAFRLFPGPIMQ